MDRCFEWTKEEYRNTQDTLKAQSAFTMNQFNELTNKTILAFAEQGINACLYWDNTNVEEFVSLVPTSAITGEGLPDLITYLCKTC